jgi:hypothetical protein
MRVNVALFELLRTIKTHVLVVLATDNMDCFAITFNRARGRRRNPTPASETLADWATICDDIISSSEVAALKAEEPRRFFGPWLSRHGLTFRDAALVDDRADNCEAFATCGGPHPVQGDRRRHQRRGRRTQALARPVSRQRVGGNRPRVTRMAGCRSIGVSRVRGLAVYIGLVGAGGKLVGYGGGLPRKRWLLEHEALITMERDWS